MGTPPLGSIVNAVVVPEAGGGTVVADTVTAYERLSSLMRASSTA